MFDYVTITIIQGHFRPFSCFFFHLCHFLQTKEKRSNLKKKKRKLKMFSSKNEKQKPRLKLNLNVAEKIF